MKAKNFIYGVYDNPELVLESAKRITAKGNKIFDIYTPFAVHGLDKVMGIKYTKLSIAAFIYGCTGFSLGFLLQSYTSWGDWQIWIGGKPNNIFLPTFIPVCFECTVLCTALGMIFTFWIKSNMIHGVKPDLFSERQTDDEFVIALNADTVKDVAGLTQLMKETGAKEVSTKTFEKHTLVS